MRRALLTLALALQVHAAPFPYIRTNHFSMPVTLIAGQRQIGHFLATYAFNFTCVSATDVCTVTGGIYSPLNGQTGTVDTTGTVPGGLFGQYQQEWQTYALCNASGFTFQLKYNDCSGSVIDITSTGTGTQVFALYGWTTGSFADNIYISAPAGLPVSTTVEFRYANPIGCNTVMPTSSGKSFAPFAGESCEFLTPAADATPGSGTQTIKLCQLDDGTTNCTNFTYPYTVVAITPTGPTPPASPSAIPGLSTWVSLMTVSNGKGSQVGSNNGGIGPTDYCYPLAAPTDNWAGMPEGSAAYYGWGLMWWNIARYTGLGVYRTGCGKTMLDFAKTYVDAGGVPGYKVYCEVLYRGARDTGNTAYATTAATLVGSTFVLYGARPIMGGERETALASQVASCLKTYGGIDTSYRQDLIDAVYSIALHVTESDATHRNEQQTFMFGFLGQAIEKDYIESRDVRALYVMQRLADRLWALHSSTDHAVEWTDAADGSTYCATGSLPFPPVLTGNFIGHCIGAGNYTTQQLMNLMSHIFGWVFAYTGNTTYRDEGDAFFTEALIPGAYTAKESAQMYWNSFNYVGWRSGTLSVNEWYGDPSVDAVPRISSGTRLSSGARQ
jgi:hypothetical protein